MKRPRGREPWSEKNIRRPYDDPEPMRLAFADPPYPEQAERHYGDHPDYAGEVDHAELLERLMTYDGWALCTGAVMLPEVAALCPKGTRVLVWRKDVMFKPGVSVGFSWEPVLIYGGRRRHRHATILADSIYCPPVFEKFGTKSIGIKPYPYCAWIFEALGARDGDTLDDLFPGSGAVGRAWDRWAGSPALPIFEPVESNQIEVA
jgi:hypothetical protein